MGLVDIISVMNNYYEKSFGFKRCKITQSGYVYDNGLILLYVCDERNHVFLRVHIIDNVFTFRIDDIDDTNDLISIIVDRIRINGGDSCLSDYNSVMRQCKLDKLIE